MNLKHIENLAGVRTRLLAVVASALPFLIAAPFGLGTGVAAAEDAPRYEVAVINDAAYGRLVMKESYDAAIRKLETRNRRGIDAFYTATNLCVAYIKTGQFEQADSECSMAIERIETIIENSNRGFGEAHSWSFQRFLAMALSNRGVLYAVSDRSAMARKDFEAAREIEVNLDAPAINLARLSSDLTSGA